MASSLVSLFHFVLFEPLESMTFLCQKVDEETEGFTYLFEGSVLIIDDGSVLSAAN